jgi:hypothetical protein
MLDKHLADKRCGGKQLQLLPTAMFSPLWRANDDHDDHNHRSTTSSLSVDGPATTGPSPCPAGSPGLLALPAIREAPVLVALLKLAVVLEHPVEGGA